ncbi:MAG: GbsR/MarR family transcriptional regulator [bacterium]
MSNLIDAIYALVEDIGKAYSDFGQPMLKGRIVGLLITSPKPLSLDEICQKLEVSKGPVSTHARQLEEMGFVRKMWVRNDRKDYYQLADDFFIRSSHRFYRLHQHSFEIAQKYLHILIRKYEKASPEARKNMLPFCKRVLEMHFFYKRVLEFYKRFIDEWPEVVKTVPTFEEYLTSLASKQAVKEEKELST